MPTIVSIGELMLRLKSPGFLRFPQSTTREATFGGGEANVAVSLAQFGHQARYVSAIPANPIGDWAVAELRKYAVDVRWLLRQGDRLGIYFLEGGASQRASRNGWSGLLADRQGHAFSRHYELDVIDRVGGGDSFAAGLIHALVTGKDRQQAIETAAAASALKHSIPGDFNLVSLAEVEALVGGDGSGRVQR